MGLEISAVDLKRYRASAQARQRSQRSQLEARRQRAWRLAAVDSAPREFSPSFAPCSCPASALHSCGTSSAAASGAWCSSAGACSTRPNSY